MFFRSRPPDPPLLQVTDEPFLILGLAGFSPSDRSILDGVLASVPSSVAGWRVGPVDEADAWLINGARSRVAPAGQVRVMPGVPSERSLVFRPGTTERPLAYSLPAEPEFAARHTFEMTPASIYKCLYFFEGRLNPLRAQIALGGLIFARQVPLREGVWHLRHEGELLATVDFAQLRAGLAPRVQPDALPDAHWERRSLREGEPPSSFVPCGMRDLLWLYAQRTAANVLPRRYLTSKIYYRQKPDVPASRLRDSHLVLLQELFGIAGTARELAERTGHPLRQVLRDLTGLYYAGALTTSRSKALHAEALKEPGDLDVPSRTLLRDEEVGDGQVVNCDLTVPVGLFEVVPPSTHPPVPRHEEEEALALRRLS